MMFFFAVFSNAKPTTLYTSQKLGSDKIIKYWFWACAVIFDWYLFHLIVCLNPDFNCFSSIALSRVDKVITGTYGTGTTGTGTSET